MKIFFGKTPGYESHSTISDLVRTKYGWSFRLNFSFIIYTKLYKHHTQFSDWPLKTSNYQTLCRIFLKTIHWIRSTGICFWLITKVLNKIIKNLVDFLKISENWKFLTIGNCLIYFIKGKIFEKNGKLVGRVKRLKMSR